MTKQTKRKNPSAAEIPTALSAVPDLDRLISQLIGYPLVLPGVTPAGASAPQQPGAGPIPAASDRRDP